MTWQVECACGAKALLSVENVPLELGARMVEVFNAEHGENCSKSTRKPSEPPPPLVGVS